MSEKKASDATGADSTKRIAVFQEKTVRRTWHDGQWWFAIVDVVAVLTDSKQPDGYLKDLRRRDKELAKGWGQIATPFVSLRKAACNALIAATRRGCFG